MFEIGRERKETLPSAPGLTETAETAPLKRFRDAIRRHVVDATRARVYDPAIDNLARSFRAVLSRPAEEVEGVEVFAWVFAVSDGYVELLRERDPVALALFGCFASLIRVLRRRWWARGWGE
ncbi:C6 zinc finger protein [Colletotrichum sojae]|uniref:C6 zinc finger protein n=1 Tax=Colletotrichum sojae TaxID=2175907 RepID=A0A8H6MWB1_9PEZI|nr:C6 zinc finger protein [Colletotrichum sojae]